jgi:hypothetical protein
MKNSLFISLVAFWSLIISFDASAMFGTEEEVIQDALANKEPAYIAKWRHCFIMRFELFRLEHEIKLPSEKLALWQTVKAIFSLANAKTEKATEWASGAAFYSAKYHLPPREEKPRLSGEEVRLCRKAAEDVKGILSPLLREQALSTDVFPIVSEAHVGFDPGIIASVEKAAKKSAELAFFNASGEMYLDKDSEGGCYHAKKDAHSAAVRKGREPGEEYLSKVAKVIFRVAQWKVLNILYGAPSLIEDTYGASMTKLSLLK